MNHDHDLEDKQIFLRKEIVDNKYNIDAFLEYIKKKKEQGDDLNLWTMDQLKEVVVEYIKFFDILKLDKKQSGQEKTSRNRIQKQCKKFKRFVNKDFGKIDIVIQKPEIVTNGGFLGFGANSVLWYTLKTSICQEQIRRADTDFDWLRSTLIKSYPNYILPPLQKSKPILPDDTKQLFKRSRMIKMFLESLSKREPLINCKLTISFLTQQDYSKFEALKKQYTDIVIPISPKQFITKSGTIDLQISPQISGLLKNIGTYNSSTKQTYKQIRQTIKEVLKNFQNITGSIYKIGSKFSTLQQKHSNLLTSSPSLKDDNFNEVLLGLKNCINQWGRTFNVQRKAVQKYLSLVLKFNVQQSQIFDKILKKRAIIEEQYTKLRMQLHKKRQKLVSTNPILNKVQIPFSINQRIQYQQTSKQEIQKIIPSSELKAEKDLRQMLGSYNSTCKNEFLKRQLQIIDRIATAFRRLGKTLLQSNKSQVDVIMRFINSDY